MYGKRKELQMMIFLNPPGIEINMMTFTIPSLAAGCQHCQAMALSRSTLRCERIKRRRTQ
ncbi:MAG: hypothetical protein ACKVK6_09475 [bacterium]